MVKHQQSAGYDDRNRPLSMFFSLLLISTLLLTAGQISAAQPNQETMYTLNLPSRIWKGDLDGMINRRQIRVLVAYNKTFYYIDKGVQRGISYDIFREFENQFNVKQKKSGSNKHIMVNVVFIPTTRDRILTDLVEGRGDIAVANLTDTPERRQLVDFTDPVLSNVKEIVVTGPNSPELHSIDDLAGKRILVRKSSSYYASLATLNARFAQEGKAPIVIEEAPENLEDEDLLEMLQAGLLEILVVDDHKVKFWQQVFPQLQLHEDIVLRSGANTAWAVRKDSPQLKNELNEFLVTHRKGTTFGNIVFQRYLKSIKYVKSATSEQELKKFRDLLKHFEKYGDQYKIDWILMAAQGYQESRLDQKVRSPVGAIGVMQVMPATGKELNVGDIRQEEQNIHAGVKYIRFMIDRYYANEPMDMLNKGLFAFASYNAGPARITSLRREAQKRGLDPNIWFNNVELIAAEKIGRETVSYVSNIYKYYIAYTLARQQYSERETLKEQLKGQ